MVSAIIWLEVSPARPTQYLPVPGIIVTSLHYHQWYCQITMRKPPLLCLFERRPFEDSEGEPLGSPFLVAPLAWVRYQIMMNQCNENIFLFSDINRTPSPKWVKCLVMLNFSQSLRLSSYWLLIKTTEIKKIVMTRVFMGLWILAVTLSFSQATRKWARQGLVFNERD